MPDDAFFGTLAAAVDAGTVPQSRVDDMVTRILTAMFQAGIFDRPPSGALGAAVATTADTALAQTVAAQGMVLLQNTGALLPIDPTKVSSIAVIGDAGDTAPVAQGGGVVVRRSLRNHLASCWHHHARRRGHRGQIVDQRRHRRDHAGRQLGPRGGGGRVTSAEGTDRATLSLADGDDALIAAVIAANPHTVVVVYSPAQVLMPWASTAPALLWGGLPGQAEGAALASVLFGDTNPAGKLPITFAVNATDYPASATTQFPGVNGAVVYSEGLLVGYRHFDSNGIAPAFPFGFGLSYTTFSYSGLNVTPATVPATGDVTVSLNVSNSGSVAGAEVAQLYVGLPAETSEPPSQLKGFQKLPVQPGASSPVTFTLHAADYSFWSAGLKQWVAYPGVHQIMVGSSSRDARLNGTFTVTGARSPATRSKPNRPPCPVGPRSPPRRRLHRRRLRRRALGWGVVLLHDRRADGGCLRVDGALLGRRCAGVAERLRQRHQGRTDHVSQSGKLRYVGLRPADCPAFGGSQHDRVHLGSRRSGGGQSRLDPVERRRRDRGLVRRWRLRRRRGELRRAERSCAVGV